MCPKGVSRALNQVCNFWLGLQDLLDSKKAPNGYLSVCALFRDEADYMEEWLEYHLMLGVDHFFLYNHHSGDNYQKVLKPYVKSGVVTLRDLSFPNPWERWQVKAYFHAKQKCSGKFHWLAAIDTDEFLCPVQDDSLPAVLNRLEKQPAVFVHWKMFGTGGKKRLLSDELQAASFTKCAPDDCPDHILGKTIAQPDRIKRFKIHEAVLEAGEEPVLPNGCPVGSSRDYSLLQLNHYWTRSEEYFNNRKKSRRRIAESNDGSNGRSDEELDRFAEQLNTREDFTIQRFMPELKARLRARRAEAFS
jgi:hypothetical protein